MKRILAIFLTTSSAFAEAVQPVPDTDSDSSATRPVLLRVVRTPGVRTLYTHDVKSLFGMGKQGAVRMHMFDEVEESIFAGEKPGELLHETRRLARKGGVPGDSGMWFDSRKWEAGDRSESAGLGDDWKRVRAMTVFMIRGADGRAVRAWEEGPDAVKDFVPTSAQVLAMEDYLEAKVFWPDLLPTEPVAPGAVWPLKTTTHAQGSAGLGALVLLTGEYKLKSVEEKDGKRVAVVEFSGKLAPAPETVPRKPVPPPKRGMPPMTARVVESGTVEGSFTLDLDMQRYMQTRIQSVIQYAQDPMTKLRHNFDLEVTQTVLSIDPLPPTP